MQKNINFSTNNHTLPMIISQFTHELRNPLSLIFSEFQLFLSNHPEASDWKETAEIQEQLDYIKELLNEFSNYNNANRLSVKPANIAEILQHTADFFRPTLDYLGIRLVTEIPAELPIIPLDTVKFRQALINLLRNAQEAISHEHGEIHLCACCTTPDEITITIQDNGCGILPEHLHNIDAPFITHKASGTGLGLAITKQIIEAHGGCMIIQSTPQIGTTISLTLPNSML